MNESPKRYIFLVDDEPIQNEMLKDYLSDRFIYEIKLFSTGEEALKNLDLNPEIAVLDYHLNAHNPNAKNGVEILKEMKSASPETQIIMLSGQDKIEVAIDTMKYGAYDYVVKGESAFARIENIIKNIDKYQRITALNQNYKSTILMLIIVIGLIILISLYYFVIRPYMG